MSARLAAAELRPPPANPLEPLVEIEDFGSNPGNLRMLAYVPEAAGFEIPLVIVLHGCGQTAAAFGQASGWLDLAARHGFALLMPEQREVNNRNLCFTWFRRQDILRDEGEALSIRQMLAQLCVDHAIDPRRIFVAGLSAGGAMAGVLLATYPEIFTAGAIVAGLPYHSALNVQQALQAMHGPKAKAAADWGDLVRQASPYPARWPRLSIWHGSADATVAPANAEAIAAQWLDLHAVAPETCTTRSGEGYVQRLWQDATGREVVELITIDAMDHGWPVDPQGLSGTPCGEPDTFLIDAGLSATRWSAERWGLIARAPALSKLMAFLRG
jgi:poly(hydroxyalkanoate) depolymerase family esterase